MADSIRVRLLGRLYTLQKERGLPDVVDVALPAEGKTARELVEDLDLPLEWVEAVFCNHKAYDLDRRIRPGDVVALVPRGTPGPHRFTLGIFEAGRQSRSESGGRVG